MGWKRERKVKDFICCKLRIGNNTLPLRGLIEMEKRKERHGTVNNKRTIVVRFLHYKDKESILT